MASEQELKKQNPLHKEFQNLLDQDFKDRKLKENQIIKATVTEITKNFIVCLLYTSPSPRDGLLSRMPSSA